ncbi:hypothetical protein RCL1_005077 [Eukaryota sp. TZLM3-RCL]
MAFTALPSLLLDPSALVSLLHVTPTHSNTLSMNSSLNVLLPQILNILALDRSSPSDLIQILDVISAFYVKTSYDQTDMTELDQSSLQQWTIWIICHSLIHYDPVFHAGTKAHKNFSSSRTKWNNVKCTSLQVIKQVIDDVISDEMETFGDYSELKEILQQLIRVLAGIKSNCDTKSAVSDNLLKLLLSISELDSDNLLNWFTLICADTSQVSHQFIIYFLSELRPALRITLLEEILIPQFKSVIMSEENVLEWKVLAFLVEIDWKTHPSLCQTLLCFCDYFASRLTALKRAVHRTMVVNCLKTLILYSNNQMLFNILATHKDKDSTVVIALMQALVECCLHLFNQNFQWSILNTTFLRLVSFLSHTNFKVKTEGVSFLIFLLTGIIPKLGKPLPTPESKLEYLKSIDVLKARATKWRELLSERVDGLDFNILTTVYSNLAPHLAYQWDTLEGATSLARGHVPTETDAPQDECFCNDFPPGVWLLGVDYWEEKVEEISQHYTFLSDCIYNEEILCRLQEELGYACKYVTMNGSKQMIEHMIELVAFLDLNIGMKLFVLLPPDLLSENTTLVEKILIQILGPGNSSNHLFNLVTLISSSPLNEQFIMYLLSLVTVDFSDTLTTLLSNLKEPLLRRVLAILNIDSKYLLKCYGCLCALLAFPEFLSNIVSDDIIMQLLKSLLGLMEKYHQIERDPFIIKILSKYLPLIGKMICSLPVNDQVLEFLNCFLYKHGSTIIINFNQGHALVELVDLCFDLTTARKLLYGILLVIERHLESPLALNVVGFSSYISSLCTFECKSIQKEVSIKIQDEMQSDNVDYMADTRKSTAQRDTVDSLCARLGHPHTGLLGRYRSLLLDLSENSNVECGVIEAYTRVSLLVSSYTPHLIDFLTCRLQQCDESTVPHYLYSLSLVLRSNNTITLVEKINHAFMFCIDHQSTVVRFRALIIVGQLLVEKLLSTVPLFYCVASLVNDDDVMIASRAQELCLLISKDGTKGERAVESAVVTLLAHDMISTAQTLIKLIDWTKLTANSLGIVLLDTFVQGKRSAYLACLELLPFSLKIYTRLKTIFTEEFCQKAEAHALNFVLKYLQKATGEDAKKTTELKNLLRTIKGKKNINQESDDE